MEKLSTTESNKNLIILPKPADAIAATKHERQFVKEVPGLSIIQGYITPAEEGRLFKQLDKLPWVVDFSRKLQYYGYRNEREKPYHLVPIQQEIPECLDSLMDQVVEENLIYKRPEQVIINDYEPGQGIRPHFDRKDYFDNTIIGVSLGSDCVMEFTPQENKKENTGKEKVYVYMPRRSLYVIEDDARYEWLHGIPGRKNDKLGDGKVAVRQRRISITFRNVIQDKVKRPLGNKITQSLLNFKFK